MASIVNANVVNTNIVNVSDGVIRFGDFDDAPNITLSSNGLKVQTKENQSDALLELTNKNEMIFGGSTIISRPAFGDAGIYQGVPNTLVEIDLGEL